MSEPSAYFEHSLMNFILYANVKMHLQKEMANPCSTYIALYLHEGFWREKSVQMCEPA